MKRNRVVARAHKAAEKILSEHAAPYSRIRAKSLCMLGWIDGYRAALRAARRMTG